MRRIVALTVLLLAGCSSPATESPGVFMTPTAAELRLRMTQSVADMDRSERIQALEYWREVRRIEKWGQIEGSLMNAAEPVLLLTLLLTCSIWVITMARIGSVSAGMAGIWVERKRLEVERMRFLYTTSGTVYLPSPGSGDPRPIRGDAPAMETEQPPGGDVLRREALRQACLVFLFQADRLREASGGKDTGLSERSMVRAGIVTGPAWEQLTGVLMKAGVLDKRGGVTDYSPEFMESRYEGARSFLAGSERLPFPAGRVPHVNQPFAGATKGDAAQRTSPHRTASGGQ